MKKFVIIAGSLLFAVSCVNQDYDLDNLNKEMNVLEGSKIAVNQEEKIVVGDFIDLEKNGIKINSDGAYYSEFSSEAKTFNASDSELSEGFAIQQPLSIDLSKTPDALKQPGVKLSGFELSFTIDNPCSYPVYVSGVAKGSGKSYQFSGVKIPANSTNYVATLPVSDKLDDFFTPVPENITIEDLKLTSTVTKAVIITGNEKKYAFKVAASSLVNLKFKPHSKMEVEYESEQEIVLDIEGVSIESCTINGTITNGIPLAFEAEASGEGFTIDKITVPAGTPSNPSVTEFTLKVTAEGKLTSLKNAIIKASVINDSDVEVFVGADNFISIKVGDVTLDGGINVDL